VTFSIALDEITTEHLLSLDNNALFKITSHDNSSNKLSSNEKILQAFCCCRHAVNFANEQPDIVSKVFAIIALMKAV